jgi:hypothetical protein
MKVALVCSVLAVAILFETATAHPWLPIRIDIGNGKEKGDCPDAKAKCICREKGTWLACIARLNLRLRLDDDTNSRAGGEKPHPGDAKPSQPAAGGAPSEGSGKADEPQLPVPQPAPVANPPPAADPPPAGGDELW